MPPALANITVVEVGDFISAPFCARLLGDLGAEVIKVEAPSGDPMRRAGPFPADVPDPERSALFRYLNFNKKGVTLSIDTPTGRSLLGELIRQADVFVTSMPFGSAERLHLGYESLKVANELLVLTSVTPFGWHGPQRDDHGDSGTLAHAGGWGYVNPRLAPSEEVPPLTPPGQLAEFNAGLSAANGTLFAIFKRNRSGFGQHVDVSVQDCVIGLLQPNFARYSGTGQADSRVGRSFGAPLHVMPCKDGYVYAQCETQEQWERFVEVMGNPEWANDELFATRYSRADHWEALEQLINTWLAQHTKWEVYHMTQRARIPFGPVVTAQEVWDSPQLAARGFFVPIDDTGTDTVRYPKAPFQLTSLPWEVRYPPPRLGEHNKHVFCGRLGLSERELVCLSEAGIV